MIKDEERSEAGLSLEDLGVDPALAAVMPIITAPECTCEFVDIGVGHQKVSESPDCPKCTDYGLAGAVLGALFKAGLLRSAASIADRHAAAGDLFRTGFDSGYRRAVELLRDHDRYREWQAMLPRGGYGELTNSEARALYLEANAAPESGSGETA